MIRYNELSAEEILVLATSDDGEVVSRMVEDLAVFGSLHGQSEKVYAWRQALANPSCSEEAFLFFFKNKRDVLQCFENPCAEMFFMDHMDMVFKRVHDMIVSGDVGMRGAFFEGPGFLGFARLYWSQVVAKDTLPLLRAAFSDQLGDGWQLKLIGLLKNVAASMNNFAYGNNLEDWTIEIDYVTIQFKPFQSLIMADNERLGLLRDAKDSPMATFMVEQIKKVFPTFDSLLDVQGTLAASGFRT